MRVRFFQANQQSVVRKLLGLSDADDPFRAGYPVPVLDDVALGAVAFVCKPPRPPARLTHHLVVRAVARGHDTPIGRADQPARD